MSDTTKIEIAPAQTLLQLVRKRASNGEFKKFISRVREACTDFLMKGIPVGMWETVLRDQFTQEIRELSELIISLDKALTLANIPHQRLIVLLQSYTRSLAGALSYFATAAQSAPPGQLQETLNSAVVDTINSVASDTLDEEYALELTVISQKLRS